jgi:lantibiotic modifying enzyme
MHSWCHGSPGTVGLFIRLHRSTGKARHLDVARKSGKGLAGELGIAAGRPAFANPTLCCGAAGCLDAFCSVYEATKDKAFLEDARAVADSIIGELRQEGKTRLYAQYDDVDAQAKKHPYYPTGFMVGNSGVGYAFLRLSAVAAGQSEKLVLLPDNPFSVPVAK